MASNKQKKRAKKRQTSKHQQGDTLEQTGKTTTSRPRRRNKEPWYLQQPPVRGIDDDTFDAIRPLWMTTGHNWKGCRCVIVKMSNVCALLDLDIDTWLRNYIFDLENDNRYDAHQDEHGCDITISNVRFAVAHEAKCCEKCAIDFPFLQFDADCSCTTGKLTARNAEIDLDEQATMTSLLKEIGETVVLEKEPV